MTDRRQSERRVDAEMALSPAWNLDHVNRRRCATNRRNSNDDIVRPELKKTGYIPFNDKFQSDPLTGTMAAQRDHWAAEAQTAWQQVAELRELLRRELGDKEARRVMTETRP